MKQYTVAFALAAALLTGGQATAALTLPDATVTANRQDSGTGSGEWFGEHVSTLTIDAQNVAAGQYVRLSGKITGISSPHSCYAEIGLIPKSTWDYWQTTFGGAWKSAVFDKGIYAVHWSDNGLGVSLEEDSSHVGPYAWPLAAPTPGSCWELSISMHPSSGGDAYLAVTGQVDTAYWDPSWGPAVLNIYGTQPYAYSGNYSQCYLIARIWSSTQNATFSHADLRAEIVPEPAGLLVLGFGGTALLLCRRRR